MSPDGLRRTERLASVLAEVVHALGPASSSPTIDAHLGVPAVDVRGRDLLPPLPTAEQAGVEGVAVDIPDARTIYCGQSSWQVGERWQGGRRSGRIEATATAETGADGSRSSVFYRIGSRLEENALPSARQHHFCRGAGRGGTLST